MRQTVNAVTRKVLAILLGTVAGALVTMNAFAQKTTEQGIQEYRDMLADGNPAELIELRGEDLWKKPQGPKNASLEQCDVGMGPGKLEGAVAQMPRFFSDAGQVMDIETRLVHCMVTLQGRDVAEITKKPFSSAGEKPSELESLVAYIYAESRGATIKVPQSHPEERAARARAEVARTGQVALVARLELLRCATRVASLVVEPCAGFDALAQDAAPADQAYARYLSGTASKPACTRLSTPAAKPGASSNTERLILTMPWASTRWLRASSCCALLCVVADKTS